VTLYCTSDLSRLSTREIPDKVEGSEIAIGGGKFSIEDREWRWKYPDSNKKSVSLVAETAGGTKTTALGSQKGAFGSENACRRQFFRRSATKLRNRN
jgi:hypothetical protein